MPSYKNTLQYLYGLERFGIRLGLERINALLKLLGNPHKKFPVIHVAGTNGKGSTSAMIASIIHQSGYKVGLYTSPHLAKFNERIRINGKEITDKKIVELTERIRGMGRNVERIERFEQIDASKGSRCSNSSNCPLSLAPCLLPLTFFEFTTAMAFLYFAEEKVDIAVIEAGLGGRLDATNVCKPLVSIITNVSKEHEDILGKGIKKIAFEKAGIIKTVARGKGQGARGKLQYGGVITGCSQPSVLDVIHKVCKEKNAGFYRLGKDFSIAVHKSAFDFIGRKWHLKNLKTNLLGRHQYTNAGLALSALEILSENPPLPPFSKGGMRGFKITEDVIRKGLENVRLQGRLQIVSREPAIVLDSAHNPASAKVLRDALISEFEIPITPSLSPKGRVRGKRLILVIGIMADKDIKGFLSILAPIADLVILTKPNTHRAARKEMLVPIAKSLAKNVKFVENVKDAYGFAKSIAGKDDLICVTGSFYTVGEALKTQITEIFKNDYTDLT